MSKFNKPNYQQHFISLKYCPLSSNGSGKLKNNYFYWEFDIKPSDFSRIYKVLLIWDFTKTAPRVYILNDEIHNIAKEKNIPHLYSQEKIQLCLYYPSYNEFSRSMSLCETIVPWTFWWLSYYEEWLHSREWKGGGIHPAINQKDKKVSPLKKVAVNKRLKKKKVKKSDIDKIYEKRRKVYLKNIS
ncbi:MAG TPA: hypothetical protein EYG73_00385 [Arcobacter sp.]|nr:hypothetical protein [Arcobacter sp.]